MSYPLRLLSAKEVRILRTTKLHDYVRRQHEHEVRVACDAIAGTLDSGSHTYVEHLQKMLVAHLEGINDLAEEIFEQVRDGGLPDDTSEPDLWDATALWIVERKLQGWPHWDPTIGLEEDADDLDGEDEEPSAGRAPRRRARRKRRRKPLDRLFGRR